MLFNPFPYLERDFFIIKVLKSRKPSSIYEFGFFYLKYLEDV